MARGDNQRACVLWKSALSAHELEGSSSSGGTPGQETGKGRPKTGSVFVSDFASSPEWMASTMARVYLSGHRFPLAPPTWSGVGSGLGLRVRVRVRVRVRARVRVRLG